MAENEKKYRILSLDGGGCWALMQVKCLRRLFTGLTGTNDPTGHQVLQHFDLVAGNSGGSLVAAAMAENYRLSEIEQLFLSKEMRKSIFSRLSIWDRSLLSSIARLAGIGPKYATDEKLKAMMRLLPTISLMKLSALPATISSAKTTHFIVVAYDYYRNRAELFRSDLKSRALTSVIEERLGIPQSSPAAAEEVTLVQAIHASSTAPVNFFDRPACVTINKKSRFFWDGGVTGNNNPVLVAITEAWSNGYTAGNIQVLSLGTGGKLLPEASGIPVRTSGLLAQKKSPGLLHDLEKMASSILNDPPDFATFVAYNMLYPDLPSRSGNFIRLNPVLRPVLHTNAGTLTWDLPPGLTINEFERLKTMEMDAVRDEEIALISRFCDLWLDDNIPNQSIRNNARFEGILGHNVYSEGAADFGKWWGGD